MNVLNARSRLESIEEQLTNLSALKSTGLPNTTENYLLRHAYNGRASRTRNMGISATKHAFRTDCRRNYNFPDIIYRNNNYVENVHVTGNNENKNIIFIQQFYIPKQHVIKKSLKEIKLLLITITIITQQLSCSL